MTRHRPTAPSATPAIPDDNAPVPPAHRPTWWTVRTVRALAFLLVGLAVAVSLASAYFSWQTAASSAQDAAAVNERLAVLEDDLAERTRQRNAERDAAAARDAATRAELSALLCELLGQLPADSPNLDRIRETLGCTQPGVSADAAPQLQSAASSAPAGPASTSTAPVPRPDPAPAPPASPSSEQPHSDPSLLCGLLPLC